MARFREQAQLLKLMAHPVRLQILDMLCCEDECVCHLSAATGKSQPYISQQLAVMRNAGLIVDRKEGNNVYYGLANDMTGQRVTATLAGLAGERTGDARRAHQPVAACPCPKCSAVD